ncbi:hypothetical protein TYRP_020722 [Tyrophagus putrescentiae]|nr:hypothetical protein TYRP_020722 [Tyrophagus putrescentiae]
MLSPPEASSVTASLNTTSQSINSKHSSPPSPLDWPNRKRNHTLLICCHCLDLDALRALTAAITNAQHRSHHRRRIRRFTILEV